MTLLANDFDEGENGTVIYELLESPGSPRKLELRNLKFATYLKFATCRNTYKNNELR